jgi:hypothetical protein
MGGSLKRSGSTELAEVLGMVFSAFAEASSVTSRPAFYAGSFPLKSNLKNATYNLVDEDLFLINNIQIYAGRY